MLSPQKRPHNLRFHVLVVDSEPATLGWTCALLLDEGVDVSTARTAAGLVDRVSRIEPDVILMDVLMPGLETNELGRLAARCTGGNPALVVHTKLLKPMLRRVVDLRAVYDFIPKGDDASAFVRSFRDVADRLVSDMPTQVFVPRLVGGVTSGTYAVKKSKPSAAPGSAGKRARAVR